MNASLPMAAFRRNVTFSAVDIFHMGHFKKELISDLLKSVLDLAAKNFISYPSPIEAFSVSTIEAAFRHLQSGRSMGRNVITVTHSDVALVSPLPISFELLLLIMKHQKRVTKRRGWTFDRDGSYLIAGGLGGLGREICTWMADKGAKHLILPSRSGPSSEAAVGLVSQLQKRGVNIVAPKCDITSPSSLSKLLEGCALTMPPIRGCINAAMALHVCIIISRTP